MIRAWFIITFIFVTGCYTQIMIPIEHPTKPNALRQHVEQIISPHHFRNYQNVDELNRVADYIKKQIASHDYSCGFQAFQVKSQTYKNVVCKLEQGHEKTLVIGAHYDVAGEQDGADDNASGVAGLIELARLLMLQKDKLKYNLELVAYTLEEPPFFATEMMGSYVHAKSLKDNNTAVKGMIALEMIGFYSEQDIQEYPAGLGLIYPSKADFIAAVSNFSSNWMTKAYKQAANRSSDLKVERLAAPSFVTGVDFSDHRNYWTFGYDAMMLTDTSFYRNKNYHEASDTIDTLNFEKMAQVIDGLAVMISDGL